ncbi:MAG: ATP-dependent DNA helicase RecG, partial [Ruminococcus sp.]
MNEIYKPIESLDKIGKARTEKYHKLGINTIYDLLYYIPRDYVDFRKYIPVSEAKSGEYCVLKLKITGLLAPVQVRNMMIYKASATDGESDITVIIYNNFYAFNALQKNAVYYMYGKVNENLYGREILSPQCIPEGEVLIQPKYKLTAGLTANMIRANIKQSVEIMKNNPFETLPEYILKENNLCPIMYALENIHFPESMEASEISRKRLAFEEILTLQLSMAFIKSRNKNHTANIMNRKIKISEFLQNLPFELTDGQKNALDEIISDLCCDTPMNRLLQGDVGSGKTAVAGGACYFAFKNGFQSALMAPTEILASQHYATLSGFLEPLGVHVCLLTGSVTAKNRRDIKEKIKSGFYSVIVGTHAIIQKDIEFNSLALVITDEQHRFGVRQRESLAQKGNTVHVLVMSATPIPRTLAIILYGDLHISVLDELPANRLPIKNCVVNTSYREKAYRFIEKEVSAGRQIYVICPMVEEGEMG